MRSACVKLDIHQAAPCLLAKHTVMEARRLYTAALSFDNVRFVFLSVMIKQVLKCPLARLGDAAKHCHIALVKAALGHADWETTQRYVHTLKSSLIEAGTKFGKAINYRTCEVIK